MHQRLPYRISALLLADLCGKLTEEEKGELQAWRMEHSSNDDLYFKIIKGKGFQRYLLESNGYNYRSKFAMLERRMKRKNRETMWKVLSCAAVIIPFMLIGMWLLWGGPSDKVVKMVPRSIRQGSAKVVLTMRGGDTVSLEEIKGTTKLDSNLLANNTSLSYTPGAREGNMDTHTLSIPRGGEFFVQLEDGTKVWLNSESEIQYPSVFRGGERKVVLKGEAYFEVNKDSSRPFIVVSGGQQIQVLGTSFGVRAYADEQLVLTTLVEGAVQVQVGDRHVVLKPGEQSKMQDGLLEVKSVNTLTYTAWHTGKLIFVDQSLGEILSILSRWYDIEVVYTSSELARIQFTGELIRYNDFEELLNKFEVLEKIKFEIKDKIVFVSSYN